VNHFLGSTEFVQPKSLDDVIKVMAQCHTRQQQYFLFAGGTDLVPYLKNYPEQAGTLVSLSQVQELRGVFGFATVFENRFADKTCRVGGK
jgi:CO/xanthine dehydrogenase FAD-binding subunit